MCTSSKSIGELLKKSKGTEARKLMGEKSYIDWQTRRRAEVTNEGGSNYLTVRKNTKSGPQREVINKRKYPIAETQNPWVWMTLRQTDMQMFQKLNKSELTRSFASVGTLVEKKLWNTVKVIHATEWKQYATCNIYNLSAPFCDWFWIIHVRFTNTVQQNLQNYYTASYFLF